MSLSLKLFKIVGSGWKSGVTCMDKNYMLISEASNVREATKHKKFNYYYVNLYKNKKRKYTLRYLVFIIFQLSGVYWFWPYCAAALVATTTKDLWLDNSITNGQKFIKLCRSYDQYVGDLCSQVSYYSCLTERSTKVKPLLFFIKCYFSPTRSQLL